MKTISKYLVLAAMIGLGYQAHAQTKSQISGKLEGLGDQTVYLRYTYGTKNIADSVKAINGSFVFSKQLPASLMTYMQFGKRAFLSIPVAVGEKITIKGDVAKIDQATISGAKNLAVWKEWSGAWKTVTATAGTLYKRLDSMGKTEDKRVRAEIDQGFAALNQRLIDSVKALVKRHPSSLISPYVILDRFVNYPNPEQAKLSYNALSKEGQNTTYGKELFESIQISEKTAMGKKPDFSVLDTTGKTIKLSDLKGQYVLVDFWASWCVPCRKENPNLTKAYAKYHAKGFEILGVSLDDKKPNWLSAIKADQLTWLHGSDLKGWKSELATQFGIKSIPMNFLVDQNGAIVAKDLRGDALEKKLDQIFAEKSK